MTQRSDFLPFAALPDANVISQLDYVDLAARKSGFQSGVAHANQLNKVWRQSSLITSVLAQFMADGSNQAVFDDGDMEKLGQQLQAALRALTQTELKPYALLASPTFSGQPKAPTPKDLMQLNQITNVEFVVQEINRQMSAMTAGQVAYFPKTSAPAGWLKLNGACVLRSVYSALDQAIYCGNDDNPTAVYGYRCVDAQRPNDTRSPNGDYLVLPDLRGEFIRSWDDGRGVDLNRLLRRLQGHALQKHGHSVNDPGHDHGTDEGEGHDHIYVKSSAGYGHGGDSPLCLADNFDARTSKNRTGLKVLRNTTGIRILETGDTETRPRNITLLACIKY